MTSFLASLKGEDVCISPGKASYSPKIPITGPPLEYSAMNAVGMSATPDWMVNPFANNSSFKSAELLNS